MRLTASSITIAALLTCGGMQVHAATLTVTAGIDPTSWQALDQQLANDPNVTVQPAILPTNDLLSALQTGPLSTSELTVAVSTPVSASQTVPPLPGRLTNLVFDLSTGLITANIAPPIVSAPTGNVLPPFDTRYLITDPALVIEMQNVLNFVNNPPPVTQPPAPSPSRLTILDLTAAIPTFPTITLTGPLFTGQAARAAPVTCSGELTFSSGSDMVYSCSGNLDIGLGFLQADTSLTFNAAGHIALLDTVWVNAPALTLNAGDTVTVNGAIYMMQDGASLTINSAVPEPSTYALMGLGLVGIALLTRRRPLA